jgi:hypothetical protein
MISPERQYISRCKKLIEEKFHLINESGTLRQRDLEFLADCIDEQSGIKLSLSTLKRLWKKDYDQTPHPSTLNALVSVLGYKDWPEFKLQEMSFPLSSSGSGKTKHWPVNLAVVLSLLTAVTVLIWMSIYYSGPMEKSKPVVKGSVIFTGNKTVEQGVPNTIIFNYDVTNIEADSFFFQQSWNPLDKVTLDPQNHYYSSIYYYPGFHKAKLIANDSVIKRFRVHITTEGWMPVVRYSLTDQIPTYLKNDYLPRNGALHIRPYDLLASNVNVDKGFVLSYFNIREFENTESDNFSLDTRVISDSIGTMACPGFELVVHCEEHIFFLRMMGKGCERDISIKMGEIYQDGIKNDLSVFGSNLYRWHDIKIQVVDKRVTIYLDKRPVYWVSFKQDFGKVMGLVYNFKGTGAIDYVKLTNGGNKLVYQEDFDD